MTDSLATSNTLRPGEVSYNGVSFPPTMRSKATVTPVLDDSGRVLKYQRIDLSLEGMIYYGSIQDDGTPSTYTAPPSVGGTSFTTDVAMTALRRRLSQPCQKLMFTYEGLGEVIVNNPADSDSADVDNGPKPRVVSWAPMTNKMAYVRWECSTAILVCSTRTGDIAQFPFTVRTTFNDESLQVRTITGSLERALTRIPDVNGSHALASEDVDYNAVRKKITAAFPKPRNASREYEFTISNDRKTVEFTITDTQLAADARMAYGKGCVEENVTLTSASSLDSGGFGQWETSLSGSIRVSACASKLLAFDEITRLFNLAYTTNSKKGKQWLSQSQSQSEGEPSKLSAKPSTAILTGLSFSDEIFGNSVSFEIRWSLFTSLPTLFEATGLFLPWEKLSERAKGWDEWSEWGITSPEEGGWRNILWGTGTPYGGDVIVSLCENWTQVGGAREQEETVSYEMQDDKTKPKKKKPDVPPKVQPEDAWADYQVQFSLHKLHNSTVHVPLGGFTQPQEPVVPKFRAQSGFAPDIYASDLAAPDVEVHARSQPIWILTMRGYAVRLCYPVPIPHVQSYGGQAVIPIGQDEVHPRLIGRGIDPNTGSTYSIHSAMWAKSYAIQKPPQNAIIVSDAHKSTIV